MKEIVQDGTPILREIAVPVPEKLFGSAKLSRLVSDMTKVLGGKPEGVALAAPQIGVSYRIFIVRKDRTLPSEALAKEGSVPSPRPPQHEIYINPEIIKTSRRRARADEGCLSIHGVYGTTKRHERVTVRARRPDGTHFQRGSSGIMAQIFEHEIDHLNGILFTDHAERLIKLHDAQSHTFAFFGTPDVASDTLAILIERGFIPSLVITSPDAPRGRGLALTPSPTKMLALDQKIPLMTPEKLDTETITAIGGYGCDYAVVVAYGKIFPEELIQAFPKGVLNVHYSLLPKYRGATPLESALLAGEEETGVTIQKMVFALDAGDIVAQRATPIGVAETAKELRPRLISLGAELLAETLLLFERGEITPVSQPAVSPTPHARKLKKEDGLLLLDAPAQENWNKYRAYADSIGTYFYKNEKRIKIVTAKLENNRFVPLRVIPEGKREIAYS